MDYFGTFFPGLRVPCPRALETGAGVRHWCARGVSLVADMVSATLPPISPGEFAHYLLAPLAPWPSMPRMTFVNLRPALLLKQRQGQHVACRWTTGTPKQRPQNRPRCAICGFSSAETRTITEVGTNLERLYRAKCGRTIYG